MDSGVATRPIEDFAAYHDRLDQFVWRSGLVMKPVFERARSNPRTVAFAEGEDERVLRAVQVVFDEGLARPVLIGRRAVVEDRMKKLGLRVRLDRDLGLVDPEDDPRYRDYWTHYHALMARKGVSPDLARTIVRPSTTVIGDLMVKSGAAQAMVCAIGGAPGGGRGWKNM